MKYIKTYKLFEDIPIRIFNSLNLQEVKDILLPLEDLGYNVDFYSYKGVAGINYTNGLDYIDRDIEFDSRFNYLPPVKPDVISIYISRDNNTINVDEVIDSIEFLIKYTKDSIFQLSKIYIKSSTERDGNNFPIEYLISSLQELYDTPCVTIELIFDINN